MTLAATRFVGLIGRAYQQSHQQLRALSQAQKLYNTTKPEQPDENAGENKLVTSNARELIQKEFPDHFSDGKFVSRMSYVEFIDESLARLKELGIHRDINAYKELLRIFPPGMFWPKPWTGGHTLFCAPQQLAAIRLLHQMQMSGVKPDKEIEKLVISAFSKKSDVWIKVVRTNYWSMKLRNLNPNPLPEVLPKEPHQLAKVAIARMLDDPKSIITVTNSSRVPSSVDKTWIVFSQSPGQKDLIEQLPENSTLYIEEGGLSYVDRDYLSYYLLKFYVDDETRIKRSQPPKPDFNYNTVKFKFYGKPVKEKLKDHQERHYTDGSYILGICATGTSSQDSLLSWLKIMEERNPKLRKMNILFSMSRSTPELVAYQSEPFSPKSKATDAAEQEIENEEERWKRRYTKKD